MDLEKMGNIRSQVSTLRGNELQRPPITLDNGEIYQNEAAAAAAVPTLINFPLRVRERERRRARLRMEKRKEKMELSANICKQNYVFFQTRPHRQGFVTVKATGFKMPCAPFVLKRSKTCELGKLGTYRSDSQAQPEGLGQIGFLSVNFTTNQNVYMGPDMSVCKFKGFLKEQKKSLNKCCFCRTFAITIMGLNLHVLGL